MLLFGCAVLGVASLRWALDYDEGVYTQTARLLASGHPLVTDVFISQPPLFPAVLLPGWLRGGIAGARIEVLMFAVVAVLATWWLGRAVLGRAAAAWGAALLAASPAFLAVAGRVEAEVPALALALVALALLVREPARAAAARTGRSGRMVLSGVLFGAAVMIKLLVVPMAAPAVLLVMAMPGTAGRRVVRVLLWGGSAGVVVLAVAAPFWHGGQLYGQTVGFHVAAQGFQAGIAGNLVVLRDSPVTTAMFALAGLTLLVLLSRQVAGRRGAARPVNEGGWPARLVVPVWFLTALGFLVVHVPLFDHHLLLAVPPAALLIAAAAGSVARPLGSVAVSVVTAGLLGASCWMVAHGPWLSVQSESSAVRHLRALPRDSVVVSDDQALVTIAGLTVPGSLVDTSYVRIDAGSLTAGQICAALRQADAALLTAHGRFTGLPQVARCARMAMRPVWSSRGDRLYRSRLPPR